MEEGIRRLEEDIRWLGEDGKFVGQTAKSTQQKVGIDQEYHTNQELEDERRARKVNVVESKFLE